MRGAGDLWQSAVAKLFLGSLFYLIDADDRRAIEKMGTGKRGESVRRRLDKVPPARSFADACRHARRVVGDALPKKSAEREQRDWTNLCDALAALAADCDGLDTLIERIAEQSRALRRPSDDAVVLSTVHSAKGLEWEAVFVVGLEEGRDAGGGRRDRGGAAGRLCGGDPRQAHPRPSPTRRSAAAAPPSARVSWRISPATPMSAPIPSIPTPTR